MALIWEKNKGDTHYEVRSAGRTLRLYTNGVFHTQYNPAHAATGYVWDLLMLPALFYAPTDIKRILVLGVGGGAVMHMLRKHVQPDVIEGVELDSVHIQIARRFFGLKGRDIQLHQADAVAWLDQYSGEKFDLIIDDLFMEKENEPVAVVEPNNAWFKKMLKHLTSHGAIVRNFISRRELLASAPLMNESMGNTFSSIFQFNGVQDENYVAAYFRKKVTSKQLYQQLSTIRGLNPQLVTSRLRFKTRRLK